MKHKIFFGPDFKSDFFWKGFHLRVGSIGPRDQAKISKAFHDLSSESIRFRFLGSKKEFSSKELDYLTKVDGLNHYALGIEEIEGLERGIAVIRMIRTNTCPEESEVAVTIIDEFQRIGLGTFLLNLMICAAFERGVRRLSFNFMPTNEGIRHLIHRMGNPMREIKNHDCDQLVLDLSTIDLSHLKSQLAETLPEFEQFQFLEDRN
jgi:GNAT superfamily N-acetyltransferase